MEVGAKRRAHFQLVRENGNRLASRVPFALTHEGRRLQPLRSSLLTATTVAVPPAIMKIRAQSTRYTPGEVAWATALTGGQACSDDCRY
jgi:hypothetical protein